MSEPLDEAALEKAIEGLFLGAGSDGVDWWDNRSNNLVILEAPQLAQEIAYWYRLLVHGGSST